MSHYHALGFVKQIQRAILKTFLKINLETGLLVKIVEEL